MLHQVRAESALSGDHLRVVRHRADDVGRVAIAAPGGPGELRIGMRHLPETERQVLSFYYFEDLNLKEIGKRLELSESRVCQLHSKAIAQLKRSFAEEQLETQLAA